MKKTMLALMATVGLAFGAKADVLNSTGFEGLSTFDVTALEYEGDAKQGLYWAVTNTSADLSQTVLTAYGESATPVYVPDAFTNASNSTYLKVDTGADVLYRSVAAAASVDGDTGMPLLNTGTAIGEGLYFDANVQFTASDGEPTIDSADKLVVWLQATEGETPTTNLVVTAAASADEYGVPQGITDFVVSNVAVDADTWYRLTVKAAVDASDHTYFNIYVDNNQVVATDRTDFYSMVNSNTTEGQKITAVGFQGTGAVDNLVWTTEDPFPPEATYTLALTFEDEDAAITSVTVNDVQYDIDDASLGLNVTFPATTETLTISVDLMGGYAIDGWESAEKVITVAEAVQEDVIALTLTVVADGGGEEPTTVEPGGVAQTTTEEAAKAVVVKAPDGSGITDGETYNTYASYFTQKVTGSGSEWTTTFELNESGTNAVEAAFADLTDEDAGVLAVVFSDKTTTVTVGVPQGFYWALSQGASLGDMTNAAGQLSTTGSVTVEPNKALGASGFYQLLVSPQQIPAK